MLKTLKLATRKSQLALWQAQFVKAALEQQVPELSIEIIGLNTAGDEIQDQPLAALGGKGLFIKRLEEALLQGYADFAVHSMKDVPPALTPEFYLPAILQRASPFDVLVAETACTLKSLPHGAVVGTSSVRRAAALKYYRSDLKVHPIRGNVDTRLAKLLAQNFDALILAEAGLKRLGNTAYIREIISPEICLPSVGQGALGIECLRTREEVIGLLQILNHPETRVCIEAERSMNAALKANCTSPVGSFACIQRGEVHLRACVFNLEGTEKLSAEAYAGLDHGEMLGQEVADVLLAKGARELL